LVDVRRERWDKRPGEPQEAFEAFEVYRDIGPTRGLRAASDESYIPIAIVKAWSVDYDWQTRAEAWDHQNDLRKAKEALGGSAAMKKRHIKMALEFQQIIAIEKDKLLRDVGEYDRVLKPQELIKLCESMTSLERLSRDEPTAIEETRAAGDPKKMLACLSTEELMELKRIQRKMLDAAVGSGE
jgi:hypothetical protein